MVRPDSQFGKMQRQVWLSSKLLPLPLFCTEGLAASWRLIWGHWESRTGTDEAGKGERWGQESLPSLFALLSVDIWHLLNIRTASHSDVEFFPKAMVLSVCFPDQKHQHHLASCGKWKFQRSTLDLLNQKLWRWHPAFWVLTSYPSNSDLHLSLRTIGLKVNSKKQLLKVCVQYRLPNGIVFYNVPIFTCHFKEFAVCNLIWVIFFIPAANSNTDSRPVVEVPIVLSSSSKC